MLMYALYFYGRSEIRRWALAVVVYENLTGIRGDAVVKKILSVLSAVILTFLLFSSVNALPLSDLDTRFSVQLSDRERALQCDFLIISNGMVSCTNENIIEQVALPLVTQLNIFYMGKEYNLPPQVGENDMNSINAMSMRKGQAVLARRTGRMNIIGSIEPGGHARAISFIWGVLTSLFFVFLFFLYQNKLSTKRRVKGGKGEAVVFSCSFCEKSLRVAFPFNARKFSCSNCHNKYDIRTLNDKNKVYLFIPETEVKHAGSKHKGQSRTSSLPEEVKKALFLFGLNENVTFDDVKYAYRKCMAEYHPDKVSHLGEELQKIAEEKTKAYNMAFDVVKKYFKRNT